MWWGAFSVVGKLGWHFVFACQCCGNYIGFVSIVVGPGVVGCLESGYGKSRDVVVEKLSVEGPPLFGGFGECVDAVTKGLAVGKVGLGNGVRTMESGEACVGGA